MNTPSKTKLAIPTELLPATGRLLPSLSHHTINRLTETGWSRVGLVVPLITRAGKLLMFEHKETFKSREGMLGPLGETSKGIHPVIEQPLETLHRGIGEETGTREPHTLGLRMRDEGGWFINRWPVGVLQLDEYACAVCPPVYVPPSTEDRLLAQRHINDEVQSIQAMSPDEIRDTDPAMLRPGVLGWLTQLESTDFLEWPGERSRMIDFSSVFASSMVDLDLRMGG